MEITIRMANKRHLSMLSSSNNNILHLHSNHSQCNKRNSFRRSSQLEWGQGECLRYG